MWPKIFGEKRNGIRLIHYYVLRYKPRNTGEGAKKSLYEIYALCLEKMGYRLFDAKDEAKPNAMLKDERKQIL